MKFFSGVAAWLKRHFIPSEENVYRPHALSRDVLVAAVALVCVVEGFLMASLFLQSSFREFSAAVLESAIVSMTNAERTSLGEGTLHVDPKLTAAAQAKADDMIARGYFSHQDPNGGEPWKWIIAAGYRYAYAGENLAAHFYESSDVVAAWMASPSHRANIVKDVYSDIGIGIARGTYQGRETIFVVQFFGTPLRSLEESARLPVASAPAPTAPEATVVSVETNSTSSTTSVSATQSTSVEAPPALTQLPTVEGESTGKIPGSVARILSSPRTISLTVLGSVLSFLIVALFLAFAVRIHLQPVDLLINGAVVAAFTIALIAANIYIISGATVPNEPAAAISAFEDDL